MKGYLQAGSIVVGIAALLGFMGMVSSVPCFFGGGVLLLVCSVGIVIVGLILTRGRLE